MTKFKNYALMLSASALAFSIGPIAAHAQSGQDSDQIVVRGIKKSLEDAATVKRNSSQIVDAISAEDIGALADQNIADSLQRVSGVQIRRSGAGEGDSVDIRGFSQNRYEINGRTLREFNGRSSDASRDDGQQSLLGIIPSELVGRIEVFKLMAADQIEGSQGGTVNIITRKPLDNPGLQIAGSVEGSYADLSEKFGYGFSGLISDTFADDTFGVLVNVSLDEREVAEDRFFSFNGWIPNSAGDGSDPAQVAFADPNGDGVPSFRIRDLRFQRTTALRRRLGGSATFQWEPSDAFSSYADVFYARQFSNEMRQWFAIGTSGNASDYSDYVFSERDSLLAGTLAQQLEGNVNTNPDNVFESISGAVGGKWTSGPLTMSGEFSLAKGSADIRQQFIRVRSNEFVDVSFDFRTGDLPSLVLPATLNGADIFDLSQYNVTNVFDRVRKRRTDELTGRFDIDYEVNLGPVVSLETGIRYSKLEVDPSSQSLNPRFSPGTPADDPAIADYVGIVEIGDLLPGRAEGFPRRWVGTFNEGVPTNELCSSFGSCPLVSDDIGSSFILNEDTVAGYFKTNFEGELFGVPFSGNGGVRVVHTGQRSEGLSVVGGAPQLTIADRGYTDVLPSGIVTFSLSDQWLLRLGAAKIMARPNTGSLTPAVSVNTEGTIANGGNPELDPFRATQYDVSLEWYGEEGAAVTVALFYKDVASFVTTSSRFAVAPGLESLGQITINTEVNGEGGKVKGVEFAAQRPFTFLPSPFDGFGLLLNYAFIDSSSPTQDIRSGTAAGLPLEGLSKHNVNSIFYYDKYGFNVRAAYNYRTDFLSTVNFSGVFQDASSSLDASISYDINDHFTLDVDFVNVLRTEQRLYGTFEESLQSLSMNDRRIIFGVRGRF